VNFACPVECRAYSSGCLFAALLALVNNFSIVFSRRKRLFIVLALLLPFLLELGYLI